MQVHVEHLLHRGLPVREKEIHPFAPEAAEPKGSGKAMSEFHQPPGARRLKISEIRGVLDGNDEQVAGVHRLDVHERGMLVITVEHGDWEVAMQNLAKYARYRHGGSWMSVV